MSKRKNFRTKSSIFRSKKRKKQGRQWIRGRRPLRANRQKG